MKKAKKNERWIKINDESNDETNATTISYDQEIIRLISLIKTKKF